MYQAESSLFAQGGLMTRYQKWVLRWMRDEQHGAFRFRDQWIWPQDVRQDAELAERIYEFKHAPRRNDEAELDERD